MITNIDLDEALVAEAIRITGARSKREVVDRALRELVSRASRPSFKEFAGLAELEPGYDPKGIRGEPAGQWRVEEVRASYAAPAAATSRSRVSTRVKK